jgi:transcriptional regulator GlxA family with amidase domain
MVAFLLASTGLLKGKNCSTHSLFANEFRTMLPDVILTEDKITAHKSAIYPSGGVTSY